MTPLFQDLHNVILDYITFTYNMCKKSNIVLKKSNFILYFYMEKLLESANIRKGKRYLHNKKEAKRGHNIG